MNTERKAISEKEFVKTCKEYKTMGTIVKVIAVIITVLSGVSVIGEAVSHNIEGIFSSLLSGTVALTLWIVFNFMCQFFKRLSQERTPFTFDAADKLKGASKALLAGALVYIILVVLNIVFCPDTDKCFNLNFPVFIVLGYGLFRILAYTFDYGAQLQKESDETL